MPEATVHEYGHLSPRKEHVGGTSKILQGTAVDKVTEPSGVDSSSERELGTRVAAAICPHARAHPR